jgi:hypothetical protein
MRILKYNRFVTGLCVVLVLFASNALVLALPPDPDNAALLYYQAFLLRKQPDETMKEMLGDLSRGKMPVDKRITEYVESSRRVIELTIAAADIPICDWGLKFSDGWSMEIPYLWEAREIFRLLIADARILAGKADYESAFNRCVSVRKLASHAAEQTTLIGYLAGSKIDELANKCIHDILSSAPLDLEGLESLKRGLEELEGRFIPLKFSVRGEHEHVARYMSVERVGEILPLLEGFVFAEDKARVSITRDLILGADEQFFERNRAYWQRHAAAVMAALDLPYAEAYSRLKGLADKPGEDFETNPDATLTAALAPLVCKAHNYKVQRKTYSNAVRAAVELYIVAARTSQLPDGLTAGLPKDLFSGEDFEYEKKADGFVLRCRGKDLKEDKIHEYEFKVRK